MREEAFDPCSAAVTGVAKRVGPSVASRRVTGAGVTGERWPAGSGSAVVVTPDGFALTSAHVVGGNPQGDATLADGVRCGREVAGSDPPSDLAVVRLEGAGLAFVTFGDAGRIQAIMTAGSIGRRETGRVARLGSLLDVLVEVRQIRSREGVTGTPGRRRRR